MTNALKLIRQWSDLPAPSLDDLVGTWRAEFVPPLRHIAPVGLGLIGLPRWYGKRFEWDGQVQLRGVNLLEDDGQSFTERLPMGVTLEEGRADGRPSGVVSYPVTAARPWRWIRDEFRLADDGGLVGMSMVDWNILCKMSLPFRLRAIS